MCMAVGIATRYVWTVRDLNPRRGRDSLNPDPEAHPFSYSMGISYSPGLKRPGRDADYSTPSTAGDECA